MYRRIRECCGQIPLSMLIAFGFAGSTAWGQQSNPFFVDEAKAVQQVSLSKEAEPTDNEASGDSSVNKQLTISIRYLLVDDETRRNIYAELNPQSIRHSAYAAPESDREELSLSLRQHAVDQQITSYGHSATAVVDALTADAMVQLAVDSPTSEVSQAPSVILQQQQTAEVNDIVQRPLVVDVERGQIQPVVKVFEEGTRIRLLARLVGDSPATGSIDLTTEFVNVTIAEIKQVEVLGIQETPTTLQHPICSTTKVVVTEQLAEDQMLLLDPHVKQTSTVEVESTSVLGKLPLFGRSFTSTESISLERNLILLIKPAVF